MTPMAAQQAMLNDKTAGPLFATIKQTYPQEFEALKNDVAKRGQSFEGNDTISDAIVADLAGAQDRHRPDMEQAPHDALADYRKAEIALMETLQSEDASLCADYVTRGGFRTPAPSPTLQTQILDFQRQMWTTAAAGRDTPSGRKITKPGPEIAKAIARQMQGAGFDDQAIKDFLTGREAPAPLQCSLGLAFFRAIDALPSNQADEVDAYMASHT